MTRQPYSEQLEDGSTRIVMPLDGVNADGSPRQVAVVLPPGRKLDPVTVAEIAETLERVARRKGSA